MHPKKLTSILKNLRKGQVHVTRRVKWEEDEEGHVKEPRVPVTKTTWEPVDPEVVEGIRVKLLYWRRILSSGQGDLTFAASEVDGWTRILESLGEAIP